MRPGGNAALPLVRAPARPYVPSCLSPARYLFASVRDGPSRAVKRSGLQAASTLQAPRFARPYITSTFNTRRRVDGRSSPASQPTLSSPRRAPRAQPYSRAENLGGWCGLVCRGLQGPRRAVGKSRRCRHHGSRNPRGDAPRAAGSLRVGRHSSTPRGVLEAHDGTALGIPASRGE